MESKFILSIAAAAGAAIFIYPIFVFGKVFSLTKDFPYRRRWIVLIVLTTFFFCGYLFVVLHGAIGWSKFDHNYLIGAILFFGAIFVYVVATLFFRIIKTLDETVQKRTAELEVKHEEAMDREREVQYLKDQFLFVAAHELRTPITAMKWNLDVLYGEGGKGVIKCGAENVELIDDIRKNNDYLVELVNDLLDASRMDCGTFSLKYEAGIDSLVVVDKSISAVRALAKEQGITLSAVAEVGVCVMEVDARWLKRILVNLLSNSIKYNIDGGKVDVAVICGETEVRFDVRDSGIGIAAEDMEKLFQKFSRLDSCLVTEVCGSGLGLFIVKRVVEKMGGRIWVESEGVGKGATFSFILPVKQFKK